MQIFIYIIIFIVGFIVARATTNSLGTPRAKWGAKTKDELVDMSQEGRASIQMRLEKRRSRILDSARTTGRITNDDVEDMFCISDNTARRYLNELEAEGKLTQIGESGRGVYYEPVK